MSLTNFLVEDAKIINYLLKLQSHNDKSKFLAQAGFTQDNPEQLKQAILTLADTQAIRQDRIDEYGIYYRIEGELAGITRKLEVVTVWQKAHHDNTLRFITLKPRR